jgi:hypothetical protein
MTTTCSCQILLIHNNNNNNNNNNADYEPSYCYSCIQIILREKIACYQETLSNRNKAKQDCANHLLELLLHQKESSPSSKIEYYQDHMKHQADKLNMLRDECASKTISLASLSLQNSNRTLTIEQQQERIYQLQHQLYMLRNCILYEDASSLTGVMDQHVQVIKKQRFQLVIEAFQMHRLDVGEEYSRLSMNELLRLAEMEEVFSSNEEHARFKRLVKEKVPSGIGTILGLCMPHRGPSDFYGIIPHDVLTSSLRYIASLTNIVARCLGIDLPHPIVLNAPSWNKDSFFQDTADIVQSVPSNEVLDASTRGNQMTLMSDLDLLTRGMSLDLKDSSTDSTSKSSRTMPHILAENGKVSSSSTASLMSLVGSSSNLISRAAHRAFDKMKGTNHDNSIHYGYNHSNHHHHNEKHSKDKHDAPWMEKLSLETRLQYASYAVVYESNQLERGYKSTPVKYELKPPSNGKEDESYTIGLQLLQNDIVALAIRAGVPVTMLWPAEAMLLNLHSLYLFCQSELSEQ